MLQLWPILVAVEFLAQEHEPILLQSTSSLLFLQNFALIVDSVSALAAITRVIARCARKTTDAVGGLEVEASTDTRWSWPFFLHIRVHIYENLTLSILIAFEVLEGNLICIVFLAHSNVSNLVCRLALFWTAVLIGSEWHNMVHVGLGKLLDGSTTVTLALFVNIAYLSNVIAWLGSLLSLVILQDSRMQLIISFIAPVVLWTW